MFQDDNVGNADGGNVAEPTGLRTWSDWYAETQHMEDSVCNAVGWDRSYVSSSVHHTNVYGAPGYEYGSVSGMSTKTGATGFVSVNEVYLFILITKS